ncbi:NAD(P)H-binding protein [Pseudalkalibacillus caeni]|uniref:NAD-dependent epimerase/dehydratase family protein n=1 Tax=Exobacillus caeni TaxID=2574798 RepID=A0A5R9F053_9BACL|nr:NAD(P)H-binding protein [Pseudalkalibacillus caeni]TLS36982.1 NAD-dependent epimerase/dehydratase family protein [Pseudalkalibacillus caeni]
MKVAVMGASGSVGEHVIKFLSRKNYESVAVINETNKTEEMKKLGATEVAVSNDEHFEEAFADCDAVIYVSGASPNAGETKTVLVDHRAVIDSVKETKKQGIDRFVFLSAIRANEPEDSDSRTTGAKDEPDELLRQEGLTYTIIRPSHLVDKPGSGKIEAAESVSSEGEIPREDVAAVLVEVLENEATYKQTYEVTAGDTRIEEAF